MLYVLSIPYKEDSLNSDKYNHNKVKHPLGELILNTDDEVFLHLIIYFSNRKTLCLSLWIKCVIENNSFLLQWQSVLFSQAKLQLDLMFPKQKTKQWQHLLYQAIIVILEFYPWNYTDIPWKP